MRYNIAAAAYGGRHDHFRVDGYAGQDMAECLDRPVWTLGRVGETGDVATLPPSEPVDVDVRVYLK
jgi:hypothetical protein